MLLVQVLIKLKLSQMLLKLFEVKENDTSNGGIVFFITLTNRGKS